MSRTSNITLKVRIIINFAVVKTTIIYDRPYIMATLPVIAAQPFCFNVRLGLGFGIGAENNMTATLFSTLADGK